VELPGARASFGGWGLGGGLEDGAKTVEEDDEDDPLDWDQAQVSRGLCISVSVLKFSSSRLSLNEWSG
jgi:hypothetical protein